MDIVACFFCWAHLFAIFNGIESFNPFMTEAAIIETNQFIDLRSKWTGFYMITASVMKGLNILLVSLTPV